MSGLSDKKPPNISLACPNTPVSDCILEEMVAVWYLMQEHLQIVLSLKMLYLATKDLRKITIHSVIPHGHLA